MASTSSWILPLKVVLISTGILAIAFGLKLSVPLVLEFSVSQAPLLWSTFRSWLKPPYLYVIINGIIITIAASSRFHKSNHGERDQPTEVLDRQAKISVDQQPAVEYKYEYEMKSSFDFGTAEETSDSEYEQNPRDEEAESETERIPLRRMDSSEIFFPAEKPPASARFGHRKPAKANPEAIRSLRVAKPKRHETIENTWKMIMEGRSMPLTRHWKKSDTLENHGCDIDVAESPPSLMMKSETFRDRTNYQLSSLSQSKLRKEPSLSQDELNRRVEAFIQKFNDDMRLQRQESLNQYMEMINRGS